MRSLALLMEMGGKLRTRSAARQGRLCAARSLAFRDREGPLVIHDELQPAQAELRGHHVEIDRESSEVQREVRVETLEECEQQRGHHVEHPHSREVACERVAFPR